MLNTREHQLQQILKAYYIAKRSLLRSGFANEIDWQYEVSIENLSEKMFLREAAWVVLSSGFRESVLRRKFDDISYAFHDWDSSFVIVSDVDRCKNMALTYFNHVGKINAIVQIAEYLHLNGFNQVHTKIKSHGVEYLKKLPYIGPITSYHLAKNIGFSLSKPDRHLSRMANALGYLEPNELCTEIAEATNDPVSVVDLVLWRYATQRPYHISQLNKLLE